MKQLHEKANWKPVWTINKYRNDADYDQKLPYETKVIVGNLLLNAGITSVWDLITGATATAFNNANARIGVGDSTTAAAATQTGLVATTNTAYATMASGYPTVSSQTTTWEAVFGASVANYDWNEFVIDNGTTAMNRLVDAQGTKVSGQTWTVTLAVTLA